VGARRKDILVQFLVEASSLGVMGGVLGVLAGALTAELIKVSSGLPVVLAPGYMLVSLIFSIATGMIFGIYPAWKATALNPIEALSTT